MLAQQLRATGVLRTELARQLRVPTNRITQIIHGRRAITSDSAQRLGQWFDSDLEFWASLQGWYCLNVAKTDAGRAIEAIPTGVHRGNLPRKRYVLHQVRRVT